MGRLDEPAYRMTKLDFALIKAGFWKVFNPDQTMEAAKAAPSGE
jgi:hypothetical protein